MKKLLLVSLVSLMSMNVVCGDGYASLSPEEQEAIVNAVAAEVAGALVEQAVANALVAQEIDDEAINADID